MNKPLTCSITALLFSTYVLVSFPITITTIKYQSHETVITQYDPKHKKKEFRQFGIRPLVRTASPVIPRVTHSVYRNN